MLVYLNIVIFKEQFIVIKLDLVNSLIDYYIVYLFLMLDILYYSYFCCFIDISSFIGYKIVLKVVSEIVKVGVQVQVGENFCGFFNIGKCYQNELRYQ